MILVDVMCLVSSNNHSGIFKFQSFSAEQYLIHTACVLTYNFVGSFVNVVFVLSDLVLLPMYFAKAKQHCIRFIDILELCKNDTERLLN